MVHFVDANIDIENAPSFLTGLV